MAKPNETAVGSTPKKGGKKTIAIVIAGVLLLCCTIAGVASTSDTSTDTKQEGSSNTADSNNEAEEPVEVKEEVKIEYVTVNMRSFTQEYDDNQISAERKYTDTYIQTTGYVSNISEGIFGGIYVSIDVANDSFLETNIQCFPKNEDDVLSLKNGTKITVRGKVGDQSMGIISLDECEVL